MRAFRMVFTAALPFETNSPSRARSSASSLTTNFLLATAISPVGSTRQDKNQRSHENATAPSQTVTLSSQGHSKNPAGDGLDRFGAVFAVIFAGLAYRLAAAADDSEGCISDA